MGVRLALFDLDNTLLAGDSDFEWAQFLIAQGVLDRELYEARNHAFYAQYKAGTLDIHEFLDFQLKPLSRHPRGQLDAWRAQFMESRIRPIMLPKARELIATEPEEKDGAFTGAVSGTPSFREGKVARLDSWLAARSLDWASVEASRFYSDSLNDLPLLERVSHPVAVDPDETLRAAALARGWPVISLR